MASRLSLKKAAGSGAVVGALLPLVNLLLEGGWAAIGIGGAGMLMAGGALGGAVLFVFIALVGNALLR